MGFIWRFFIAAWFDFPPGLSMVSLTAFPEPLLQWQSNRRDAHGHKTTGNIKRRACPLCQLVILSFIWSLKSYCYLRLPCKKSWMVWPLSDLCPFNPVEKVFWFPASDISSWLPLSLPSIVSRCVIISLFSPHTLRYRRLSNRKQKHSGAEELHWSHILGFRQRQKREKGPLGPRLMLFSLPTLSSHCFRDIWEYTSKTAWRSCSQVKRFLYSSWKKMGETNNGDSRGKLFHGSYQVRWENMSSPIPPFWCNGLWIFKFSSWI